MSTIEDRLEVIEHLLATGKGREPEVLLEQLIADMRRSELTEWRLDLERTIERFQPKRRRTLGAILADALTTDKPRIEHSEASRRRRDLELLEQHLRNDLQDLSARHIFQWSTFYRDCLTGHFGRFLSAAHDCNPAEVATTIRRSLAEHTHEIFTKGYAHSRTQLGLFQTEAIQKALGGLIKFLDIGVELYTSQLSPARTSEGFQRVRQLNSALIAGIVEGFAECGFGPKRGKQLLAQFPKSWAHYYAFLTFSDAKEVTDLLDPGELSEGARVSILPTLAAIGELINRRGDLAPVPILGQLNWEERRLDIALRPTAESEGQELVEINCFMDESFVSRYALQEAEARRVVAIVAPLKADVSQFVQEHPTLKSAVVQVDRESPLEDTLRRISVPSLQSPTGRSPSKLQHCPRLPTP
jgi:hypothetical protein